MDGHACCCCAQYAQHIQCDLLAGCLADLQGSNKQTIINEAGIIAVHLQWSMCAAL